MAKAKRSVVDELKDFITLCIDADTANRSAAKDDLKFAAGDQWPAAIKQQRMIDNRPCMTINKTDTFVRSVVNNMRQQRPRIKVHPVADGADQAIAEVIEGLTRHIEVSSNADSAYDTGADYQVRMGWGYWRILAKYIDETSWEQELAIDRVRNPFSVYFDPMSTMPDGSDSTRAAITGKIKKTEFEAKYPGKKPQGWTLIGPGDDIADKDEILLVEFFRVEEDPDTLCRLNTGETKWKSELPKADEMASRGWIVADERPSVHRKIKWYKCSGVEVLQEREWAGKYIPVIPVYGAELIDNGKVIRYGMVRQLKEPAQMYNFWRTAETEYVALAPKAPWLIADGQDEGHEDEWDSANTKNYSRLKYKPIVGDDGQQLPPPQRLNPQPIPAASVNAATMASEDLKAVAGMFDPALGAPGQETSGTMVQKRQQQSDLSNYHFYDNLTRSIRWTGIVLLDLIPKYYDTQRVIRIIGEDGVPKSVTLNEQAVGKVLNDITVGRYDVVMDTGPGYQTKRQETSAALLALLDTELGKLVGMTSGDIVMREMDFPGANKIAERIAATIPAAQMDKELPNDIDPKVKQMVVTLMTQNKQLQGQVQQLSMEKQAKVFGVQEKEHAVTERELLREDAITHRTLRVEAAQDRREQDKTHAELAMNDADNATSLTETKLTVDANLTLGHMKAQQHGVPNTNRPSR